MVIGNSNLSLIDVEKVVVSPIVRDDAWECPVFSRQIILHVHGFKLVIRLESPDRQTLDVHPA